MPELPEVEVVRRGLAPLVKNLCVELVEVFHPRLIRYHAAGAADFSTVLTGQTFTKVLRRGKYLWIATLSGDALVVHLGMSGQIRWNSSDEQLQPNTRVRLSFVGTNNQLRFVDQRMFGSLIFSVGGAQLPVEVSHIALDPFDPDFDLVDTANRIRAKKTVLKRALLDQSVVSGIGNIYADEALWRAMVHGESPTRELSVEQCEAVLVAAQEVMALALKAGGTSFDDLYVHVNGKSGYFSRSLEAYGRAGESCSRCGELIVRDRFMNRSSYCCPNCQRLS